MRQGTKCVVLVLASVSCGSPPETASVTPDRDKVSVAPDGQTISVARAALDQGTDSLIPGKLGPIVDTFLDVGDKYSNAKDAIELLTVLGTYLGVFSSSDSNAQYAQLETDVQNMGHAVDWHSTMLFIDEQRGNAIWAMDRLARAGSISEGSNEDQSSGTAADVVAGGAAFLRATGAGQNDPLTDGAWKSVIPDRPPVSNDGIVYDWRLGVPAFLEIIAYRLSIITSMDPNFRWNNRYGMELRRLRDALAGHYNTMLGGIRCNVEYMSNSTAIGRGWFCADIYTGATANFPLVEDHPSDVVIYERLTSELMQALPFFQMRAMIDTLNFYISGLVQDLTEGYSELQPMGGPGNLCLDVANVDLGPEAFLDLGGCNNNSFQTQAWIFDRQTHTIQDSSTGWCLDVVNADAAFGTPVWTYWCNGTNAQKWTWDPDTGILQNALGTVLDIQNGNVAADTQVWTYPINYSIAQQWVAEQSCSNVCYIQSPVTPTTPYPFWCSSQTCENQICQSYPQCCDTQWDSFCVSLVGPICNLKCS